MPITPALTITPLSTADAGMGAAGWASGSQTCSGTRPIFSPNPATSRASVRPGQGEAGSPATTSRIARVSPGATAASRAKAISRQISPTTASTR